MQMDFILMKWLGNWERDVKINLKRGKQYSICSCGLSRTLPFCDNSHREFNAENGTKYKSVKITSYKEKIVKVTSSKWTLDEETE